MASRKINPQRIVFAKNLPHKEHLARLRYAHLFLDTFNVNAHTTASDSLWAGVPVVTKIGEQFAARVAASLLAAVGLSELVTETEQEYENLILEIATDPEKHRTIKEKLAHNRITLPLFDTKRFTKNFEACLVIAHERYAKGEPPENIRLDSSGSFTNKER